ncbi:YiiX/YebB-like N1pC/P60 family cysteine hydrolase [Nannocystis bainbridge]|uniref:YiiX/YebB-like N1pC/P60 family cysteine hydrolase n=1 Tax=Nannocystis bainbridge TaxID=2995303 RepID=A0ABT5DSH9_9BACT|nr:YiiX/YebB-like N1pC/P60 family cysteine hydrolase [Nannocystis bainbridge]MDC0716019.1 YiiX/YebB-like N1pC/P60 family cysteine hydrolase [Nannocystis bainbridge]
MWLALLTRLLAVPELDAAALRDGDILLHTSRSAQAVAVAAATASPYTHVGIVDRIGDDAFVIEAVGPTRRTPLSEWLARGAGGKATAVRHPGLDAAARAAVVAAATSYLGRPYDLSFTPGDDALYCSELVTLAYAAVDVAVGTWRPLGDLALDDPATRRLLKRRWRAHPACRGAPSLAACRPALAAVPVVTPESLAADPRLRIVGTSYLLRPR